MTNYIPADKLKAEIRKLLIPTVHDRDYDEWEHGRDSGFIEAISIIESLQQEQPEVGLNEETITNAFRVIEDKCFNEGIEGWQREKLIATHFYELGLNARKE